MKIGAREAEAFLTRPGDAAGALIYGLDAGQVRQKVAQLAESWLGPKADDMARTEFAAAQIAEDPARLADELSALSLMTPRRVILVRDADDDVLDAAIAALETRAPENFLILYATESLSKSDLKAFAEKSAKLGCVACYKDEGASLDGLIRDTLRGYGLRASTDVVRYLSSQLAGDRQIIANELEKLSLYVGDEAEEVALEDAMAAVGENNDQSLDDVNRAVSKGDVAALCRLCDRLLLEGYPPVVMVRALMRHFDQLEQLAHLRAQGMGLDAAVDALRPPVFWKAKAALKVEAARWNAASCADALARLQLLELDTKRYGDEASFRLPQGLMEIAALPSPLKVAA